MNVNGPAGRNGLRKWEVDISSCNRIGPLQFCQIAFAGNQIWPHCTQDGDLCVHEASIFCSWLSPAVLSHCLTFPVTMFLGMLFCPLVVVTVLTSLAFLYSLVTNLRWIRDASNVLCHESPLEVYLYLYDSKMLSPVHCIFAIALLLLPITALCSSLPQAACTFQLTFHIT